MKGYNINLQMTQLDKPLWNSLVAATLASSLGKSVVAPLERMKLELTGTPTLPEFYSATRKTVKLNGVPYLWKGNWRNLIRFVPQQVSFFVMFEFAKQRMSHQENASHNFAAGAISGVMSLFWYPIEFSRVRRAYYINSQVHNSVECLSRYKGYGITFLGICGYRACYFGLYYGVMDYVITPKTKNNFLSSFLIAYGTTVTSQLLVYPIDTIRRRSLVNTLQTEHSQTAWQATSQIMKNEGISSFFRGASSVVRRGTVGALTLSIYDYSKQYWFNVRN